MSDDPLIGLRRVQDFNGNILMLISNTKLKEMLPLHLHMMSDRYDVMCGCEYCIQIYNIHQDYNRYISCLIKKMERKIENTWPNFGARRVAIDRLNKLQIKDDSQWLIVRTAIQDKECYVLCNVCCS